ncbi:SLAP domain-containing protein [Companilactobacillus kedongensis]|uniref:SLAP domain-containing protein n=1 Tax=Companilactobacillus kedongensis TaxID=2486004 RepID=UPI0013DE07A7|nr:SLAP domain-containing protein [Companilactobacillus kedongensis]
MKKTIYKTGRNLLLFSALIVGGVIAVNHPLNVSAADTAAEENPDDLVASGDNDWESTDPVWSLYKINGNSNNLILHIKSCTKLSLNNASWKSYSNNISQIVFYGNVTASDSVSGLFSGYTSLTSIRRMNNLDTSNTTNFSNMFSKDPSLHSLDISGFDMSKTIVSGRSNMLASDTGLESLTLGPNNVLDTTNTTDSDAGLPDQITTGETIKGEHWKKEGSEDTESKTATELMNLYSNSVGNSRPTNVETWVPVQTGYRTSMYLQYVDASDSTQILYGSSSENMGTKSFDEGAKVKNSDIAAAFPNSYTPEDNNLYFKGYQSGNTSSSSDVITIPDHDTDPKAIPIKLKQLNPAKISVNITDGSSIKSDESFTIPVNYTEYTYSDIKTPEQELDLDNSKITVGKAAEMSLSDYLVKNNITSTNLNGILSAAINNSMTTKTTLVKNTSKTVKMYTDSDSDTTPVSIDAVYKKTDSGNSGNNNSSNNTGTITDNKQVIATGDKTVPLYDINGKQLTDYALAKNSDWRSDKKMVLDGVTYYRVSTDAWVKADDVYSFENGNSYVSVHHDKYAKLVNFKNVESNRGLRSSSDWKSDRSITLSGTKHYRVSTNEFVNSDSVYLYKPTSNNFNAMDSTTIYDDYGNDTGKTLNAGSYKIDRIANINGEYFYRVSTNQFVKVN